jgi:adenosylmethionine-8-amino-7-oxononanoate aminotransferase
LLAPPYTVGKQDVDEIVSRVVKVIQSVFEDIYALRQQHPYR